MTIFFILYVLLISIVCPEKISMTASFLGGLIYGIIMRILWSSNFYDNKN